MNFYSVHCCEELCSLLRTSPVSARIGFSFSFGIFYHDFSLGRSLFNRGCGGSDILVVLPLEFTEKVDNSSSEPGNQHHGELDDGIDVAGEGNVAVDLTELEDGEENGQEVEDP